jgi:type II secretory pathway pseudopilin PulG
VRTTKKGNKKMISQLKKRRNEEGFTLIELLIVILGILSAIVVFAVSSVNDRGNNSACKANISTFDVAVEAYNARNGVYPATFNDLLTPTAFVKSLPQSSALQAGNLALDITPSGGKAYTLTYNPGTGSITPSTAAGTGCPT